jgi:hypothetical protein
MQASAGPWDAVGVCHCTRWNERQEARTGHSANGQSEHSLRALDSNSESCGNQDTSKVPAATEEAVPDLNTGRSDRS